MVTSVASPWTTGGLKSEDSLFALTPPSPDIKDPPPLPDKHKSFQSPNHDMAVCGSAYTKSYMKHRPLRFVFIIVMTEFSLKVMKYLQTLRPYHDPVCMVWQVHV